MKLNFLIEQYSSIFVHLLTFYQTRSKKKTRQVFYKLVPHLNLKQ